jgi:hypothetical protein
MMKRELKLSYYVIYFWHWVHLLNLFHAAAAGVFKSPQAHFTIHLIFEITLTAKTIITTTGKWSYHEIEKEIIFIWIIWPQTPHLYQKMVSIQNSQKLYFDW